MQQRAGAPRLEHGEHVGLHGVEVAEAVADGEHAMRGVAEVHLMHVTAASSRKASLA